MASVLIVEDDGMVARHMARALRDAGHTPALALNARSALQELADHPDIVLLDLGLPDLPGEKLLNYLKSRPETADTPVLVITGRRETAATLGAPEQDSVSDILLKPVSAAQLCRAVNAALTDQHAPQADDRRLVQERQRDLIQRVLAKGSDLLAFHVCLRLSADRLLDGRPVSELAVTWAEIADQATREGLVDAAQASLLQSIPVTRSRAFRKCLA